MQNTKEEITQVIETTQKWITDVIIGCNFCPFAAKVFKQHSIHYQVTAAASEIDCLSELNSALKLLDEDEQIETLLLITPNAVEHFTDYLRLVSKGEQLLKRKGYEGIYQLASFHPKYQFDNTPIDDAANYTNRSVYPMLHLLREKSIDEALLHYKHPERIPTRNIQFSRDKGILFMQDLLNKCTHLPGSAIQ